jgi:hypothetical protein
MRQVYLFGCVFCILFQYSVAQTPLDHPKGAYVDTAHRYYQQAALPVYIYISTNPNGQNLTQLAPNEQKEFKPIYLDGHGKHYIKHTDALHNSEDKFAIYADGIAPISDIVFLTAPRHFGNGIQYYGRNLRLVLNTRDEMSGIKGLYQSLNQEAYKTYEAALNFEQEGDFTHKFYAVDNVGNAETPKTNAFTVDLTAPKTYHSIVGISQNNIISTTTKIYLTPTDSISGVARTFFRLDNETDRLYPTRSLIPFAVLPDGEHTLYYYSIDHVENKETEQKVTFYLDKSSPIMSADILGDRFIVGDKIYFSGRTKLKLTAVDNKSGIKQVLYSVDNQDYVDYAEPFYLPGKSGLHTIRYYALDNMGNQGVGNTEQRFDEYTHNVGQVYVDLTGPIMNYQYQGPTFQKGDTVYISQRTRIALSAFDPESGLQKITYSIDGETQETNYTQTITIPQSGKHKIDFFGYDNVNNRNIKDFTIMVDNIGPEINPSFSNLRNNPENSGEYPMYPSYVTLFLAATDANTGLEMIYYSINGDKELPYTGLIKGFKKNRAYAVKIRAIDSLGNEAVRTINFTTDKY